MEELFIKYQLIRLKHLCLLLRQGPQGWPLPQLIADYNALREFFKSVGPYYDEKAQNIVEEHGSIWIQKLK
jgi:hypothetical protein